MKCDKKDLLLYAVTDRSWLNGETLYSQVEKALEGGATFVQLREKHLDHDAFLQEAKEIKELCAKYQVPFVLDDDVELALEVGADGVHVGQSDMEAGDVRAKLGEDKIVGVSAQTVEQALLAQERGADYLGVGAVFPTSSKDDAVEVDHEMVKAICEAVDIPVIAIGGITKDNVQELSGCGLCGIAVISAIFAKPDIKKTTEELKAACEKISANGVTPWFLAGSEGWVQALAFFQIGGVYEEAQPGLYDALNNNTATFADNEKMLEVLGQFKELSDAGYLGEDWIGATNANLDNDFADRKIAMAMANPGEISAIKEAGAEDEFGIALIPLGDNDTYPTNPAGPTMFGYKGSEHPELVKEFFKFCTTTESLQSILDKHTNGTNIAVNDENVEQHWLPQEEELLNSIDASKQQTPVLQTGTKYTNDSWGKFCEDMIAYCQGSMEANDVLKNMDSNRAESAKVAADENWK